MFWRLSLAIEMKLHTHLAQLEVTYSQILRVNGSEKVKEISPVLYLRLSGSQSTGKQGTNCGSRCEGAKCAILMSVVDDI